LSLLFSSKNLKVQQRFKGTDTINVQNEPTFSAISPEIGNDSHLFFLTETGKSARNVEERLMMMMR
jgi:hypothetical protein